MVGRWLWKPWKKHANAFHPWGSPPPQSDQSLDWERIMANKRVATLEMRLRPETGEVEPIHLGVTLPDFTEWALPYILIKDDDTNWAPWHEIDRLETVCHTDELLDFAKSPIQLLITKRLQKAQTYPSPPPPPVRCLPHCVPASVARCLQSLGHRRLPGG